jgi:hypothetical protein
MITVPCNSNSNTNNNSGADLDRSTMKVGPELEVPMLDLNTVPAVFDSSIMRTRFPTNPLKLNYLKIKVFDIQRNCQNPVMFIPLPIK